MPEVRAGGNLSSGYSANAPQTCVWKNYHIYCTDVQHLLKSILPFLQRIQPQLQRCFFERHYAGGPHLRVRMCGRPAEVARAEQALLEMTKAHFAAHPSVHQKRYSPEQVKLLLEAENEDIDLQDLSYHVDEAVCRPYERLQHRLASDAAVHLLEDFLQDSMPLVAAILSSKRPLRVEILRLYFAHALHITGEIPSGCVAYKSHWEGFASLISQRAIIARIEESYVRDRDAIIRLMLDVQAEYQGRCLSPALGEWERLSKMYLQKTEEILRSGQQVTHQPSSVEEVRNAKEKIREKMVVESKFVDALFGDERFLALIRFQPRFLWPRVMTNLLYQTVSATGLPMIEKMSMCYFAHRAAETYWNCDLTEMLEETIQDVISLHAHRLEDTGA